MRFDGMTMWDLVLAPIYLILFYIIATIIVRQRYKGTIHARYFYWGLSLKFLGAIGFALVYQFYYGGGDTFRYFANGTTLYELAFDDLGRFLSYMTQTSIERGTFNDLDGVTNMFAGQNTFMVARFAAFFGLFTGMSYLPITFCFAFFSFLGVWLFYRTTCRIYPSVQRKYLAIPIFFIPSYFFWGSSIMQDSLVIGFLGALIYVSHELFILARWRLFPFMIMILSFYVLLHVKEYVIFAYAPAMLIWIAFSWQKNVRSQRLKVLLRPAILAFVLVGFFVVLPALSQFSKSYNLDNVLEKAEITAEYIHRVSVRSGGSAYSLNIEYTPLGMVRAFPQAVNATLFRPYPWEVRNPIMLLSAAESLLFLLITLWLFLRLGIGGFMRSIYRDPFLFSALVFAIFFSFAVGATTFNFGSLARYKIPMMPFYGILLSISYFLSLQKKHERSFARAAKLIELNTSQ